MIGLRASTAFCLKFIFFPPRQITQNIYRDASYTSFTLFHSDIEIMPQTYDTCTLSLFLLTNHFVKRDNGLCSIKIFIVTVEPG